MTDIVERLSQWAENDMRAEDVALTAKHEIERLRKHIADYKKLWDTSNALDQRISEDWSAENKHLRELLQNWLACCFVDTVNGGVTFGMGVKKVWAETREALKNDIIT